MGNKCYTFQFSMGEIKKQTEFYEDFIDVYLYNSKALKFSLYKQNTADSKIIFYITCTDKSCNEKTLSGLLKKYNGNEVNTTLNLSDLTLLIGRYKAINSFSNI